MPWSWLGQHVEGRGQLIASPACTACCNRCCSQATSVWKGYPQVDDYSMRTSTWAFIWKHIFLYIFKINNYFIYLLKVYIYIYICISHTSYACTCSAFVCQQRVCCVVCSAVARGRGVCARAGHSAHVLRLRQRLPAADGGKWVVFLFSIPILVDVNVPPA